MIALSWARGPVFNATRMCRIDRPPPPYFPCRVVCMQGNREVPSRRIVESFEEVDTCQCRDAIKLIPQTCELLQRCRSTGLNESTGAPVGSQSTDRATPLDHPLASLRWTSGSRGAFWTSTSDQAPRHDGRSFTHWKEQRCSQNQTGCEW